MRAAAKNPKINIVAVNDPFIPVQYVSGLHDATGVSYIVVVGEICKSFHRLRLFRTIIKVLQSLTDVPCMTRCIAFCDKDGIYVQV